MGITIQLIWTGQPLRCRHQRNTVSATSVQTRGQSFFCASTPHDDNLKSKEYKTYYMADDVNNRREWSQILFFPPFLSFLIVVAFLSFPQLYYVERSCPFQDIPPPPQRAMASYLARSKRCVKSGGKRVNQQCSTLTRIGRGRNFVG